MAEEIERLNYYQLQYLGAEDFKAEQAYHRDMRRRHNVAHHRWGIVVGLELIEKAKPNGAGFDVFVQPGFAIDGYGREIVVSAPAKLDPADFKTFTGPAAFRSVWIAYREITDTSPPFGYESCEDGDQNKRINEQFRIVIEPAPPLHGNIIVDGKSVKPKTGPADTSPITIPQDESVPYQELPDSPAERWLVRLGTVSWNALTQQFEAAAARLNEQRVHTAIVAADVLSPIETLMLRRREKTAVGEEDATDFATINGRLQVDGRIVAKKNILLHGGRASFQTAAGSDDNVPLWVQRMIGVGGAGYDLRIHIGSDAGATLDKQRLTIGPGSNENAPAQGTEKVILAVKADDTLDVPTGTLSFGAKVRQMLNLWAKQYGIGVQSGTLYHRTANAYAWFLGGEHDDAQFVPGAAGSVLMTLNAAPGLTVHAPIRSTQNIIADTGLQTGGDVLVDGGKVALRLGGGGIDTDEISLQRFRHAPDQNDLRVVIGDNLGGGDAFTVGPRYFADGQYKEQFKVTNQGDVTIKGDVSLEKGKALLYGTNRFPVDVIAGESVVGATNTAGSFPLTLTSRLPYASSAHLMVALEDISNDDVATWAGWGVWVGSTVTRVDDNTFTFTVNYWVDDIDGHLNWVSWIALFVA